MTKEEILQHLPDAKGEGLDWLSETLADYRPDWKQQAARAGLEARLSAEIRLAGGRSEKAVKALLDLDSIQQAEDPEAAMTAAHERVKADNDDLFEKNVPAGYSAATGTGGEAPDPDAALRRAFGL